MTSVPWLLSLVFFAGSSLIAAAHIAGLIIALRRWHLGTGARLAAIGFALLAFTLVINLVFYQVQGFIFDAGDDQAMLLRLSAFGALSAILSATGSTLVVLGLRAALQTIARLHSEPCELRESDVRP